MNIDNIIIPAINGHMAKIYSITNSKGLAYVGSTTIDPKKRWAFARYSAIKLPKSSLADLLINGSHRTWKYEILEECSDNKRFDRENHWIDEISKTRNLVNRCRASTGPIGHKRPKHLIDLSASMMKSRWKNDRNKMLKRVNAHKTKEFQKSSGKLGGKAKAKLRPYFEIRNEHSGKLVGIFQDDQLAASALGWSIHVFRHFKRGNKRKTGYILRWKRG